MGPPGTLGRPGVRAVQPVDGGDELHVDRRGGRAAALDRAALALSPHLHRGVQSLGLRRARPRGAAHADGDNRPHARAGRADEPAADGGDTAAPGGLHDHRARLPRRARERSSIPGAPDGVLLLDRARRHAGRPVQCAGGAGGVHRHRRVPAGPGAGVLHPARRDGRTGSGIVAAGRACRDRRRWGRGGIRARQQQLRILVPVHRARRRGAGTDRLQPAAPADAFCHLRRAAPPLGRARAEPVRPRRLRDAHLLRRVPRPRRRTAALPVHVPRVDPARDAEPAAGAARRVVELFPRGRADRPGVRERAERRRNRARSRSSVSASDRLRVTPGLRSAGSFTRSIQSSSGSRAIPRISLI